LAVPLIIAGSVLLRLVKRIQKMVTLPLYKFFGGVWGPEAISGVGDIGLMAN
jgi:hypothetical protein